MRVTVRPTRGEVPWTPSHNYDCTNGHYIQADFPVSQCPTFSEGASCEGDLIRVGRGSRSGALEQETVA